MSGLIEDNKRLADAVIELSLLLADAQAAQRKAEGHADRLSKRLLEVTKQVGLPYWERQFENAQGERCTGPNSVWDWANSQWVPEEVFKEDYCNNCGHHDTRHQDGGGCIECRCYSYHGDL